MRNYFFNRKRGQTTLADLPRFQFSVFSSQFNKLAVSKRSDFFAEKSLFLPFF